MNVPYELTWSCYEGGEKPCGKCGTCIDRAAAFEKNGVKDPALDQLTGTECRFAEMHSQMEKQKELSLSAKDRQKKGEKER